MFAIERGSPLNIGSLIEELASKRLVNINPEELRASLMEEVDLCRFVSFIGSSFLVLDEEKWLMIEGVLCEALANMLNDDNHMISKEHLKNITQRCKGPLAEMACSGL